MGDWCSPKDMKNFYHKLFDMQSAFGQLLPSIVRNTRVRLIEIIWSFICFSSSAKKPIFVILILIIFMILLQLYYVIFLSLHEWYFTIQLLGVLSRMKFLLTTYEYWTVTKRKHVAKHVANEVTNESSKKKVPTCFRLHFALTLRISPSFHTIFPKNLKFLRKRRSLARFYCYRLPLHSGRVLASYS